MSRLSKRLELAAKKKEDGKELDLKKDQEDLPPSEWFPVSMHIYEKKEVAPEKIVIKAMSKD